MNLYPSPPAASGQAYSGVPFGASSGGAMFGAFGGSFGGSSVGAAAPQPSFDLAHDSIAYDRDDEEEKTLSFTSDDSDDGNIAPVSTTPRQPLQTEQTTEVEEIIPAKNESAIPTKTDRLKSYNLEAFPWLQQYLVDGEDAFSIPSTPTKPAKKYLLKNKTVSLLNSHFVSPGNSWQSPVAYL